MTRFIAATLLLGVLAIPGRAQDRGFGAGVILGDPTGLSFKGWVAPRNGVDAGLAWSFRHKGYFHLHADYLWHFLHLFPRAESLVLYAGPGARLGLATGGNVFGIRIAGGIAYWTPGAPFDIFLEIAPIMDLIPSTDATVNGGIGVRFFFP